MAMGDVRGAVGAPRITQMAPAVSFHRHIGGAIENVLPWLTGMQTSKSVDGSAGTFVLRLLYENALGERRDWQDLLADDDWVMLGVQDGDLQWLLMVGMIDSVTWEREVGEQGDVAEVFIVTGRDLTKPFIETPLLMMPHVSYDPALAYGTFYSAVQALSLLGADFGPGETVRALYEFMMRAGDYRTDDPWWRVPDSLPLEGQTGRRRGRQLTDLISLDRLDTSVEGSFAAFGSLLSEPGKGSQIWDVLQGHCHTVLNEFFIDLAPTGEQYLARRDGAASIIAARPGEGFSALPSLVLRERPFPVSAEVSATRARGEAWARLARTTASERETSRISLSRGAERWNYFLVESGGGSSFSSMVLAQAALAAENGDVATASLFAGVPAIDRDSVQRHGLKQMELKSRYLNVDRAGSIDIFTGWTRVIRDWHCLDHLYLAGEVEFVSCMPGIRVGERLDLEMRGKTWQCYVERVEHSFSIDQNGACVHSTEVGLTRGHPEPLRAVDRYVRRFSAGGSSVVGATPAQPAEVIGAIREATAPIVTPLPAGIPDDG